MLIGEIIRQIRKSKKITLSELSQKSGVQLATLSRMENKKMTGTLASHMSIAKALELNIVDLYRDLDKPKTEADLGGPQKAMDVFTHNEASSYEILTKNLLNKKMMPVLIHIREGGKTTREQNAIGSEKFTFVLDGKVEVRLGEKSFSLGKHHTLYFDSSLPHYFVNVGKTAAKVLCVGTPVAL